MSIIKTINLSKLYRHGPFEIWALKNINMDIKKGEIICIWGRSGSGKSTLLNIIGALDKPTYGKAVFMGRDISQMKDNELAAIRKEKMGFIFQQYNLLPYLTALENVALPLKYAGIPKTERLNRAKETLELVGLKDRMNFYWACLSGGEAQRVALARSLINNPEIILADEPTGELDTETATQLSELFLKLNKQGDKTFVIVSHDSILTQIATRTLTIKDGQIT